MVVTLVGCGQCGGPASEQTGLLVGLNLHMHSVLDVHLCPDRRHYFKCRLSAYDLPTVRDFPGVQHSLRIGPPSMLLCRWKIGVCFPWHGLGWGVDVGTFRLRRNIFVFSFGFGALLFVADDAFP